MIKQKGFHNSKGINFLILFDFFQKLDLSVFVDLEKFQPWYLTIELESPKTSSFMHGLSVMKFALNDIAKGFYWFPSDKFLNFILFFPEIGFSVFVDFKKFQPWYLRSELWSPKSLFMYGLLWICFKWVFMIPRG